MSVSTPLMSVPVPRKKDTFSSYAESAPHLIHSPKNFLCIAFEKCNGHDCRGSFDVQETTHESTKMYTATFTDPTTNEVFCSGLGGEINVEKRPSSSLATPLHLAEVKTLDGKVYYRDRKLAEHAASARAIDCYMFREGEQFPNKLCLEEPYHRATERDAQQIGCEMLLNKSNNHDVSKKDESQVFQVKPSEGDPPAVTFSFDDEPTKVDLPALPFSFDDEPTEVDLPALTLSFDGEATNVNNILSTMGRITEIWTDTAGLDSPSEDSQPWSIKSTREYANSHSPSAKIESILDWYERVNNEPLSHGEASAQAQLCTKILAALGKANSELYLDEKESHINVEKDAKIILRKIIGLSRINEDRNDPSFLDADIFNAYIHCLSRLDPTRSARSAKDLLESMANHERYHGISLPLPNVGTYNAAMALWALEDGIEGQNGVNDIYSLLETASMSGGDDSLRPNNETFKTLFIVNSKIDDRFSFERAKLWLDKIQQISDSICFEAFIPDANIFNAALSSLSKKSNANPTDNPYAKILHRYGKKYDGGFKRVNECSNAEAIDVAKWLLYAEECGVNPNIEMYEAVIQAWIKTGTKDGLLIAEEWAKRAILSSAPTRLETFHPIISSWALCQFDRAPDRVKEWIRQLSALSASKPHLKPDLNTLSAQIIAWRNVQAGMIAHLEKTKQSSSEENEMVFAAAQNCTQFLEEMLLDGSKLEGPQDAAALTTMFTHTIQAWGCASRFALLHPTSSVSLDASHGIREILKIARLFYSKIYGDEPEEYAQHILHLMGESYAEIASQMHQIDSAVDYDEANNICHFCEKIAHVEKMLRDYEFYSRKHQSSSFLSESKTVRHRLYKEILRGCAGVKSSTDDEHVVSVCKLIMDHLSWQNEQCHASGGSSGRVGVEEDITDIYVDIALLAKTVVKSPQERMYILTQVHTNASPFFSRRRKFDASSYATVDRARLMGAMRIAMGESESELTEPFLRNFDERPPKRRTRGNNAMSFVHEMMNKNRNNRR